MEAAAKLPHTSPDPVTLRLSFTSSVVAYPQHASENRGSERLSPDGCAERTT